MSEAETQQETDNETNLRVAAFCRTIRRMIEVGVQYCEIVKLYDRYPDTPVWREVGFTTGWSEEEYQAYRARLYPAINH